MPDTGAVTELLERMAAGDAAASTELFPILYDELRALAVSLARDRATPTLQPTALVHELFLRLAHASSVEVRGRAHFFAVAATAMRQILVDHARQRRAQKRGGPLPPLELSDDVAAGGAPALDALVLHDAFARLEELSPRQARVAELRVLVGLTVHEVAEVLEVSPRTVDLEWRTARAWLRRALADR